MASVRVLLSTLLGSLALGSAALPVKAQEERRQQSPAEAIIYRDPNYKGPAVNVSQQQADLGLAWPVNSIRVRSGEWQLCEGANFRGTCRTYDRDRPLLNLALRGITVQSMRPTRLADTGGPGGPGAPGTNASLRGMAAEFYPAPALNGRRVSGCERGSATTACAARSADEFCKQMRWTGAARETLETVGGRAYLADVLCTRTGR